MAKRFTDTDKWNKPWFRKLRPALKCVREFLQDNCDAAGVWEIDLETMAHFIGEEISLEEIIESFGDRIALLPDNKLMLMGFIEFHYGELKEGYNPHKPAIKRLESLGLLKRSGESICLDESKIQPSMEGCRKLASKLLYKNKNKNKNKNKGGIRGKIADANPTLGGEFQAELMPNPEITPLPKPELVQKPTEEDFSKAYDAYPKKSGRASGRSRFFREIKTKRDAEDLLEAIRRYREVLSRPDNHWQQPKDFTTFIGVSGSAPWRDCLDPSYGKLDLVRKDPKRMTTRERIEAGIEPGMTGGRP